MTRSRSSRLYSTQERPPKRLPRHRSDHQAVMQALDEKRYDGSNFRKSLTSGSIHIDTDILLQKPPPAEMMASVLFNRVCARVLRYRGGCISVRVSAWTACRLRPVRSSACFAVMISTRRFCWRPSGVALCHIVGHGYAFGCQTVGCDSAVEQELTHGAGTSVGHTC